MKSSKGSFIITIDTEPDNQWAYSNFSKTDNVRYIPRFQELCEKFTFKPVYLTEYNMLKDPFFVEYMEAKSKAGLCEIGIHPHAWSTPPFVPLTNDDAKNKPFLIDYPVETMKAKFGSLMEALDKAFSCDIVSHRAGRWAFDTRYLSILKENGIKVDCSVLPYHSISRSSDALLDSGADFSNCPDEAYEMDIFDFTKPGNSGVYEVPMTVIDRYPVLRKLSARINKRYCNRLFGLKTLRPNTKNLLHLLDIISFAKKRNKKYLEFMLHSSELMPNCSPTFIDNQSIEKLFIDLEFLFEKISSNWTGIMLSDFIKGKNFLVCDRR